MDISLSRRCFAHHNKKSCGQICYHMVNKPGTEFSETQNQAYFYAYFWFCTRNFPAGDSNLRQFCFLLTRLKLLKTPEDHSGSPNLASEDRR